MSSSNLQQRQEISCNHDLVPFSGHFNIFLPSLDNGLSLEKNLGVIHTDGFRPAIRNVIGDVLSSSSTYPVYESPVILSSIPR